MACSSDAISGLRTSPAGGRSRREKGCDRVRGEGGRRRKGKGKREQEEEDDGEEDYEEAERAGRGKELSE